MLKAAQYKYPIDCIGFLIIATYGHRAAPVQAVDGSLGFGVSLEFDESASCKGTESVTSQSRLNKTRRVEVINSRATMSLHAAFLPLLVPSGPLNTVHSSMLPKGSNSLLTSSSLCCFPSMPTNNFLSSERPRTWRRGKKMKSTRLFIKPERQHSSISSNIFKGNFIYSCSDWGLFCSPWKQTYLGRLVLCECESELWVTG